MGWDSRTQRIWGPRDPGSSEQGLLHIDLGGGSRKGPRAATGKCQGVTFRASLLAAESGLTRESRSSGKGQVAVSNKAPV